MPGLRRVTDGFKDFVRRNASVRWFDRPLGESGVLTLGSRFMVDVHPFWFLFGNGRRVGALASYCLLL